jgi:hypothetical protein
MLNFAFIRNRSFNSLQGILFCRSFLSFCLFLLIIVLSVLRLKASDYPYGVLDLRLLITPMVS